MPSSEYELIFDPKRMACAKCVLNDDCSFYGPEAKDLRKLCTTPYAKGSYATVLVGLVLVHKLTGDIVVPEDVVQKYRDSSS